MIFAGVVANLDMVHRLLRMAVIIAAPAALFVLVVHVLLLSCYALYHQALIY